MRRARASRCSRINRTPSGLQAVPLSDSTSQVEIRDLQFAVALDAGHLAQDRDRHRRPAMPGASAEAALPIRYKRSGRAAVVVFSVPLTDVEDNVAVVRRRILDGGRAGAGRGAAGGLLGRDAR